MCPRPVQKQFVEGAYRGHFAGDACFAAVKPQTEPETACVRLVRTLPLILRETVTLAQSPLNHVSINNPLTQASESPLHCTISNSRCTVQHTSARALLHLASRNGWSTRPATYTVQFSCRPPRHARHCCKVRFAPLPRALQSQHDDSCTVARRALASSRRCRCRTPRVTESCWAIRDRRRMHMRCTRMSASEPLEQTSSMQCAHAASGVAFKPGVPAVLRAQRHATCAITCARSRVAAWPRPRSQARWQPRRWSDSFLVRARSPRAHPPLPAPPAPHGHLMRMALHKHRDTATYGKVAGAVLLLGAVKTWRGAPG